MPYYPKAFQSSDHLVHVTEYHKKSSVNPTASPELETKTDFSSLTFVSVLFAETKSFVLATFRL
jgi:hypothetical protein